MRSWLLSLVLGCITLVMVALTPTESQAIFFYRWRRTPFGYRYSYVTYPPYFYGPTYNFSYYRPPVYYPSYSYYYGYPFYPTYYYYPPVYYYYGY